MKTAIASLTLFLVASLIGNFYQASVRGDERMRCAEIGFVMGYAEAHHRQVDAESTDLRR